MRRSGYRLCPASKEKLMSEYKKTIIFEEIEERFNPDNYTYEVDGDICKLCVKISSGKRCFDIER